MSVMIVTSLGEIVVDLHTDSCPLTCKNFLKLCKIKYYNGCLFHTVQKDFTAQTGDPTGTGSGGDSIYKFLYGDQARFFGDEIRLDLKHSKMGTVAMASAGEDLNASQFYITLRDNLDYLDGKHTVFGEVAEGLETLNRINEAYVDEKNRPYRNIRIKHTYVLDDPFEDAAQLAELVPDASPEGKAKDEVDDEVRLEDDWVPMDEQLAPGELEEVIRTKEAHSRAVVLESIGDIPDAEIKPPDTVLFVCKLNPVTEDEDLHTIFSRFGTVTSAEIIRDFKTGDSLCYAFIEFEDKEACEQAYFKMDNALIDDRRIHVDFSQSVAKLWSQYRRKNSQTGGGCFKCGSLDHVAKDCTGSPTVKQQPAKYILKDDQFARNGGDGSSRYDMVFDEETAGSPQRSKKRTHHEAHDHPEKRNVRLDGLADLKERDYRKRDSSDRHGPSYRSKDHREDDRYQRRRKSPSSGRGRDYNKREERDSRKSADDYNRRRMRDEQENSKKEVEKNVGGDGRDEREYIKKDMENEVRGDGRGEREYIKKGVENDVRGERKDYEEYIKKGVEKDVRGDRRDERESKKRTADNATHRDHPDVSRRGSRYEDHHRSRGKDERDSVKSSTRGDYDRDSKRDRDHHRWH